MSAGRLACGVMLLLDKLGIGCPLASFWTKLAFINVLEFELRTALCCTATLEKPEEAGPRKEDAFWVD